MRIYKHNGEVFAVSMVTFTLNEDGDETYVHDERGNYICTTDDIESIKSGSYMKQLALDSVKEEMKYAEEKSNESIDED